ncbi:MAG TPA: cupin domain-containing protein [Gammaproteobacteria bacterium]|nr:cupin domain-containing protein [Gammaproteobacteria bacterium]
MSLHHARAGEIVNLRPLGPGLQNAKNTALVKTGHFEAIRMIVRAGESIAPHKVAGHITLHCLEGRVRLSLERSALELGAGDWVYLDRGEMHSVEGMEDASLLLTILFEPRRE